MCENTERPGLPARRARHGDGAEWVAVYVGSGGKTADLGPHRGWAFPKLEMD